MPIEKQEWKKDTPITAQRLNKIEANLAIIDEEAQPRLTAISPLQPEYGGTGISNNRSLQICSVTTRISPTDLSFSIENPFSSPISILVFSKVDDNTQGVMKLVPSSKYRCKAGTSPYDASRLIIDFSENNTFPNLPADYINGTTVRHTCFRVSLLGTK